MPGGDPVALDVPDACSLGDTFEEAAFFDCDGGFAWVDLSAGSPTVESLAFATPPTLPRGTAVFALDWNGELWFELVFLEDVVRYSSVLFNPKTRETVSLYHAGHNRGAMALLPIAYE